MAINLECQISGGWFERWMTVGKMKELLKELNDDWELLPNRVGNLSVVSPDNETQGYIDFNGEEFIKA